MAAASTAVFAGDADTSKANDEQGATAEQAATMDDEGSGGREPTAQPADSQRGEDAHDRWVASIWASP